MLVLETCFCFKFKATLMAYFMFRQKSIGNPSKESPRIHVSREERTTQGCDQILLRLRSFKALQSGVSDMAHISH